jgi:hypothetical protein
LVVSVVLPEPPLELITSIDSMLFLSFCSYATGLAAASF